MAYARGGERSGGARTGGRTLLGRPVPTVLVAGEKFVSALLAAGGAALAFFVHSKGGVDPLTVLLPGEMAETPHDRVVAWMAAHVPALGPRTVLLVAVMLIFWAALLGTESAGVWLGRAWGEFLIIVETLSFLPLELFDIARHPRPVAFLTLAVNLLILWYVGRLYQRRLAARQAAALALAAGGTRLPHGAGAAGLEGALAPAVRLPTREGRAVSAVARPLRGRDGDGL